MLDEAGERALTGQYVTGIGQAGEWARRREDLYRKTFGCPLIGTFNVKLATPIPVQSTGAILHPSLFLNSGDYSGVTGHGPQVAIQCGRDSDPPQYYYLCRLRNGIGDEVTGWFVRWYREADAKWRPDTSILEIYTKELIPESFKRGQLRVAIPDRMTTEEIHQWADGQYWFQGFPWLKVQRSDSQGVWKILARDNYSGASVLEIGCHTGFYSFQASKAGATVIGTDIDEEKIERSRFINDHIEMQDATFICEDFDTTVGHKRQRFDYVFCLSVLHQVDPTYSDLEQRIQKLREIGRVVWLELSSPPPSNAMPEAKVNKIVGSEPVHRYSHQVRSVRSIWRLPGV